MPATAAAVDQYKIASFKDIPQTLATQIDYPGADRWADGSVGDVCWIESTHRGRLTKSLLPVVVDLYLIHYSQERRHEFGGRHEEKARPHGSRTTSCGKMKGN
ncbi:hypothetical protein [Mesorhizobium sp.]|uniref:hypothetical protein n=1 Tax=Mesorhizobium sp. TaxID=1871066 RepID=UPI000FE42031|nr:hypothetical protein [Mesorhizobium sp.]RWG90830.1 MAG: hypothetical protein EOQ70_03815 [Mesorhizobium sp.]RWK21225.1 MAG: hypothetical protein EOR41_04535 [Mesorhizobium sp.]